MTRTHTTQTAGEAGLIELDIDFPDVCTQGIAFLAHPITTQGGSKDHKVIMIGREFSGRDHSTIVYSLKTMERDMKNDQHLRETVSDIIKNVKA